MRRCRPCGAAQPAIPSSPPSPPHRNRHLHMSPSGWPQATRRASRTSARAGSNERAVPGGRDRPGPSRCAAIRFTARRGRRAAGSGANRRASNLGRAAPVADVACSKARLGAAPSAARWLSYLLGRPWSCSCLPLPAGTAKASMTCRHGQRRRTREQWVNRVFYASRSAPPPRKPAHCPRPGRPWEEYDGCGWGRMVIPYRGGSSIAVSSRRAAGQSRFWLISAVPCTSARPPFPRPKLVQEARKL